MKAGVFLLAIACSGAQGWANTKEAIAATALLQGEDPILMQAIAKVESNFNKKAVGAVGELGLFQMRPEFHNVSLTMTVEQQTRAAVKLVKKLRKSCGAKFLQCWNMGVTRARQRNFTVTRYEQKVNNAYKNLLDTRSFSSTQSTAIAWEKFR